MKLQALFVSVVALVGLGCCEGAPEDNIFHVKYEDKISLDKMVRQLKENTSYMKAEAVAGLLAQASPKDSHERILAHYSLSDLLKVAEISTEKPLEACDRDQFLALIEMCHRFELFADVDTFRRHVSEFCETSIKRRYEFCASQVGKIDELTDKKALFGEEMMGYSEQFSAWIQYDGDENGKEEDNAWRFCRGNPTPAVEFGKKCLAWEQLLKANLLFFDQDGAKTSAYFASDKEAALLRERCRIFEKDLLERRERMRLARIANDRNRS